MSIIRQFPDRANGKSLTSRTTAWAYTPYISIVDRTNKDINLIGLQFQIAGVPAADTTIQSLFEIATGIFSNEVTIVQLPYVNRNDTAVGYYLNQIFRVVLPEPVVIKANTQINIRLTDSSTSALVYNGIKLIYQAASELCDDNVPNNFKFLGGTANFTEGWR